MDTFITLLTQDHIGVQCEIPNKAEWFQLLLQRDFHVGACVKRRQVE